MTIYSQTADFSPTKINCTTELSKISKDYCIYDLDDYILLVGFNTNNLKAMIKSKKSKNIEFVYNESTSDAMIIKPNFFKSSDKKTIIIMLELASEYSWGQKIVMIQNDKVYDYGFLNYMTKMNNGESISKYAILRQVKGQIFLTFQPLEFLDKNEKIVKSQTLKYLLTNKGLKKIK